MALFKKLTAITVIAAVIFLASGCTGKLALFINVSKGDEYKYNVSVKTTTDITPNGQNVRSVQNTSTDYSVNIGDVDPKGNITANYKFDSFKVDTSSNGITQSFDSNNPDNSNPVSQMYSSLIGKGFSAKMTKYGEVTEVNGLNEMMNSLIDSISSGNGSISAAMKSQIKDSLKQSFGDDSIISTLQQSTKVFPEGEVKPGDSWETNYNLNTLINFNVKSNYTLEKVENGWAYVTVKSNLKTDGSKSINLLGVDANVDLNGDLTGNIKIDINNGFLSEGDLTESLSGSMTYNSTFIPIKVESDVTYSTVK